MQTFSTSPIEMLASLWRYRQLAMQMSKRDAIGRYRGSIMGLAWSFFNPLLMLVIYTIVFSGIFKSRWGVDTNESRADFALLLFVGMIVHGLFAECVNRAPTLILHNVNYVKKVVFPLDIIPWTALAAALFHAAISMLVLLLVQLILRQALPWTVVLLPVVVLPLILGVMGMSWLLASLGVYVRDVGQVTGVFSTVMLFISGVFFPISALPPAYQFWVRINPLAVVIEQCREILIFGRLPNMLTWSILLVAGLLLAWLGFAWFQKTRKGFADVL
ncbi:ABC transporter permease [Hylemonella gracilis str. Niagara R]|uniref:Transport permease protein n=1 Tax=Hylemonella gracilis str. Niagara R TaxID=1458275 RepID=A0A016XE07_9BURK|nr:ABC transporter permease [Hylemonella gracilis]EYC50344.1 ABC transporter permease [Hylemonella gracilis str. Niagara R]